MLTSTPSPGLGRQLARNTAYNMVGQVVPAAAGLALLPLLTRLLGAEQFGVLALAWLIFAYLIDMGFGRATTKFVADAIARRDAHGLGTVVATSVAAQLLAGVTLGALLATGAFLGIERVLSVSGELASQTRISFVFVGVAVPFVMVASAYRGVLEAAQEFGRVNAIRVPAAIANYALPAAGALAGAELGGLVLLLLIGRVLTATAYAVMAWRVVPASRVAPRLHAAQVRPVLIFGGWLTMASVAGPFLMFGDRIALGVLAGAEAVGFYAGPAELTMRMLLIPASLVGTLFPALSAMGALRQRTEPATWRATKYLLLAMVAPVAVLVVFGDAVIGLWLGREFGVAGAGVVVILALGVLALTPAYVPAIALQAAGRADLPTRLYLIELPIFALLLWLLVPRWGVTGAAVAWAARCAIDTVLLMSTAARLGMMTATGAVRERVPHAAAACAVLVLAAGALRMAAPIWAAVGFAIMFAGALAVAYGLALDGEERAWIRGMLGLPASPPRAERTP